MVHVISSLDAGGAERVLATILDRLTNVDHVLALGTSGGALRDLVPAHVPVECVADDRQLARLLITADVDVVHTWLDDSLVLASVPAAYLGIPLVHRLYNVPAELNHRYSVPIATVAQIGRALGVAAVVIALSNTVADQAAMYYGIARPRVIHNGFPLVGRRSASSTAPKDESRFVLLAVGRLSVEKGHAVLVRAMADVVAVHPQAELWIAGTGAEEASLRTLIRALDIERHVMLLGYEEDVSKLHRAADLFVFPSLFEGFGNALVEALIAGVPVVASDLGVIRRDVLAGTGAVAFVPPGDPGALARVIVELIENGARRRYLSSMGRQQGDRFRVETMAEEFHDVYCTLADGVYAG